MIIGSINTVHFVGIGGIGMSGIAEILLNQGFSVSGSDLGSSDLTKRLAANGAEIFSGHNASNVTDSDVVVYSSAVPEDNVELLAAKAKGIPVIKRAEMLAEVTRLHYCIGIAGTHGKTTTTSLLGILLIHAGLDPTVIVGGKLHAFGDTNARLGKGKYMIVEADEYDRSFLKLNPTYAILTSLEEEHLDIYSGIDDLKNTFIEYANKVPFYGFVTLCLDDPMLQDIRQHITRKTITYGLSSQADYQAVDIKYDKGRTDFMLRVNGEERGRIVINMPGEYNVRNALATIATSIEMGIELDKIRAGIAEFTGAYRRFDIKGEFNNVMVIDDYAHHPTEVRETLKGIRSGWSRRVVCVFQPHTYTRTRDFYEDFGKAFMNCDMLIVTKVYPAREQPIQGVTGELIVKAASAYGHKNAVYVDHHDQLMTTLNEHVTEHDILIFMGAGDIYKSIDSFTDHSQSGVKS
jgi:UDP-N-acetylmuramate--alanine ligase